MTIAELHTNETLRRHEFPVCTEKAFFAHAGVCPLPRRVIDAMADYTLGCGYGDQEDFFPASRLQQSRRTAAGFLGVQPEEVAFVGPTSLGLSFIAAGLTFRRGDNILVYQDDYPSNVYPWMALAAKGVQVRFMNIRDLGRIRQVDVAGQVDENTRLVALASCHFLSGWRIDISAIGKFLHSRNILFCLDGIQTLGAFPTPLEHVDMLAADAHKWMLGPCAAGLLYVRKTLQDGLRPIVHGWHNVRCPNFVAQDQMVHPPDARRYEAGSLNLVGLAGMIAGIELLQEIGIHQIAAELLRKRALLIPALELKGYAVLEAAAPPEHASGIVTFHKPGVDLAALQAKLQSERILTSLRGNRAGQSYLRLAPHFYNTDAELQQLLERL